MVIKEEDEEQPAQQFTKRKAGEFVDLTEDSDHEESPGKQL